MLLSQSPPPELGCCFRECEDDRLRAIRSKYPEPLRWGDWQKSAGEFGCRVTAQQLRDRWYNYAKPGLDTSPFSLSERRQVAALAIDHPHDWKWIASQLGNGRCRSPAMVRNIGLRLLKKLKEVGLEIESGRDMEFVPDAVFGLGQPTGPQREEMVAQFNAAKATGSAGAGASFGDDSSR
jgi:hypothetical protein